MPDLPLSYRIASSSLKAMRPQAIATCYRCQKEHAVNLPNGGGHNPEEVAKQFRREGWEFHINKHRKVICAECSKPQRSQEPMPPKAVTPQQGAYKLVDDVPESEKPYHGITPPPVATLPVQPRDLTQQQKAKIRQLLDGTFDDSKGMYLDGYSDQKVAKEAGVPWACVTQMREAAYGPILVDGETEALLTEISLIDAKGADLMRSITAHQEAMKGSQAIIDELRTAVLALNRESRAMVEKVQALSTARKAR